MKSFVKELGSTSFPPFTGERVYMRKFTKKEGLPFDLRRWQPTVDAMLERVDTSGPVFIMIDQGVVMPGQSHRRPGVHIDGYWVENARSHQGVPPGPRHVGNWKGSGWQHCDFAIPEAIILASNVEASRALAGDYEGAVGEGGDCSHLSLRGLETVPLKAGVVYAGNVTMLHESLPVRIVSKRTLVRLNVPNWHPN